MLKKIHSFSTKLGLIKIFCVHLLAFMVDGFISEWDSLFLDEGCAGSWKTFDLVCTF